MFVFSDNTRAIWGLEIEPTRVAGNRHVQRAGPSRLVDMLGRVTGYLRLPSAPIRTMPIRITGRTERLTRRSMPIAKRRSPSTIA